jgi:phage shock protein B
MGEIAVILTLAVIVPLAIITNFVLKLRQGRGLSIDDERMLGDLWESAKRMEDRIQSLERILDADQPQWRRKL